MTSSPRRHEDETGSALILAIIVVLVLGIVGMTAAAIVTNTTITTAGSRDSAQSRAAADAGLAAAIAEARRTGSACGVSLTNGSAPRYSVSTTCDADLVTFRATGQGPNGRQTTTEAVYKAVVADPGTGGDMVFFGNTTFTAEVHTRTLDEDLLNIVIPTGDFICQNAVPANIVLGGDFISRGSCDVEGAVIAGGSLDITNSPDVIRGNVTASGVDMSRVEGAIGGDLHTRAGIDFGWDGTRTVGGSVTAGGNVYLGARRIEGSLTLPEPATLARESGTVVGTVFEPSTVAPPEAPVFEAWFDYAYRLADWQPYEGHHYQQITLAASGTGAWTCADFNSHPALGWDRLSALTTPTVLDARACTNLSSNSGTEPVVSLQSNLVLLAKHFDLTQLTIQGASGHHPRAWFIVEDTTIDARPTCGRSGGDILINGTVVSTDITAMAYTPCTVDVAGMGFDSWRGSFYGGAFDYGGGLTFSGDGILLPGMPSGGPAVGGGGDATLGALVSRRDVS